MTIKFTTEYSKETINFLNVNIRLVEWELMTDLLTRQALRLNRICSDNESFNKRCNDLEGGLMERGYNGKMMMKY